MNDIDIYEDKSAHASGRVGGRLQTASPAAAPGSFQLTADETARFVRIVSEAASITRHYELFRWLAKEIQDFVPHEILLSAWGDFSHWDVCLDVTSGLPGVRTRELQQCPLDALVRSAYARWVAAERQPIVMKASELEGPDGSQTSPLHAALRSMRCVLIHGVRDARAGHDSLYLAFSYGSVTRGTSRQRFAGIADALIAQIDGAFRRVATFPCKRLAAAARDPARTLDLSERERQILAAVCEGKTNLDIAVALQISPFTVKNHVQRIFRKIGVTNRTQAAGRYMDALRMSLVSSGA